MKFLYALLFAPFCLFILTACQQKDARAYAAFLADAQNGLTQKQERNNIQFSASFQPLDYMAGRSLEDHQHTAADFAKAQDSYASLQQFRFDIYTEGGQNGLRQALEKQVGADKWQETMQYFNFEMQADLGLIADQDTLPCAAYHLEQTGNLGNRMRFLLGFSDPKKRQKPQFDSDLRLFYVDTKGSRDTLFFTFSKEKLNQTPDFKL